MLRLLIKLPYTHWSYFFNNAGKLLASYKLFVEHKDVFIKAFYDLGQLDAFISFHLLMKEAKAYNPAQCYVFTQFLPRSKKKVPFIKLKGMWNPLIDAKVAIPNDLLMDGKPGGCRNIILTGPNAGGKSTYIKGITDLLVLSHVAGISNASVAIITPFDKINTFIDKQDDVALGDSFYMAEVKRMKKLFTVLNTVKEHNRSGKSPKQFCFSVIDEPFSGTNPLDGQRASYSVIEHLGTYKHTLQIVATHYPVLTLLQGRSKKGGFRNYKVVIDRNQKTPEKFKYTFKVKPGISYQTTGIDILEKELGGKVTRRVKDMKKNPHKYPFFLQKVR